MSKNYSLLNAVVGYQNLPPTGVKADATGIRSILIDPDNSADPMDNTTLDLAIATTSGITGDRALNYGSIHIAAGEIATGNCTLTLGDGDFVGQVIEIVVDGTITTSDLVITISSYVGSGGTWTLDAAGDGILVVWNGTQWHILQATGA